MYITKFHISNFKGIDKISLDLMPTGANIYTLIGLNESGKSTILEALSTFNIKKDEIGALYGIDIEDVKPTSYVPKSMKSNFSGEITVSADVVIEPTDARNIISIIRKEFGATIRKDSIPPQIRITRGFQFENSDFIKKIFTIEGFDIKGYLKGEKLLKTLDSDGEIWDRATDVIINKLPDIVFFPTFIFNMPDKIVLNPANNENTINKIYRQIIENLADALDRPLDIQKHIVSRVIGNGSHYSLPTDKRQQVDAVLNEMSAHLTSTVFTSWTKIFGNDFKGTEIILRLGFHVVGNKTEVYLQFTIKDKNSSYDLSERSLGFRWFFSFLLFTIYQHIKRENPTLFLLDEPASNLHAKAQMQLLDNLSKIASNGNRIFYSTHSHYMINPNWLDQAYIISNKAIDYNIIADLSSGHTEITAEKYRSFVGNNPDRVTYFQPVLDKLDFAPSKLDISKKSVLVEGKGDYLLLEYGRRVLLESKSDIFIVPTRGAAGMDELIGLFLGWSIPFAICLDDDDAGRRAKKQYIESWGLAESDVWTLAKVHQDLNSREISGFLEDEDIALIKTHFELTDKPNKSQIQLFFSEHLAIRKKVEMSQSFLERLIAFENIIVAHFNSN